MHYYASLWCLGFITLLEHNLDVGHDDDKDEGNAMVQDHTNANEGGSIATNVVGDRWECGFLRVATKAILNGKSNADDNLQDDAVTYIFSDRIGIDGH